MLPTFPSWKLSGSSRKKGRPLSIWGLNRQISAMRVTVPLTPGPRLGFLGTCGIMGPLQLHPEVTGKEEVTFKVISLSVLSLSGLDSKVPLLLPPSPLSTSHLLFSSSTFQHFLWVSVALSTCHAF